MKKTEAELIEKFKDIEKQLIDTLKGAGVKIDESADSKTTKANLKAYIQKVKKAEKLFDEYEKIALEIEKLSGNEKEADKELSEAVVDMREVSPETAVEIQNINGELLVKQKQKKTSGKAREL